MTAKSPSGPKTVWHPLQHHLHQALLRLGSAVLKREFVLLVSGGADSVALLRAFASLQNLPSLGLQCSVLHFHHGRVGVSAQVERFRDASEQLVCRLASEYGLPIRVVQNFDSGVLSEQQARKFRRDFLVESQRLSSEQGQGQVFVLGHHQDDLLETRFLRLIRGTGSQGLVAMHEFKPFLFRPWLAISRSQMEQYLSSLGQNFLLDPSQEDLRSWVRAELFPLLEKRQPGALQAMARSLDQLAQLAAQVTSHRAPVDPALDPAASSASRRGPEPLSHPQFLCLSVEQQRQALAQYLFALGIRNYSRGQIDEILKRLDKSQLVHTFRVAGLEWQVNAEQIRALPLQK